MIPRISLRKPVVAGQFYPSSVTEINKIISSLVDKSAAKIDTLGCVLPHAGYIYSGKVACQTVSGIKIKDNLILLGPNHTGLGAVFSLMPQGIWQTPLGDIEINAKIAELILNKSRYLKADNLAHLEEHSLEVELPILQYFKKNFKIIPIIFKTNDLTALENIGEELAAVIKENNLSGSVMIIASSDLTHYESQKSAQAKDALAIQAITALDEKRLAKVVKESDISMCGFAPVVVLIRAVKLLGAKAAKLIKYETSGQASQDFSSVVGYAGITIS